jgi:hypothetical protein
VAFAVWDALERNPWMKVLREALVSSAVAPAPVPEGPGPFALGSNDAVRELLDATGFDDVEIEGLDLAFAAASLDEWWEFAVQTSPGLAAAVSGLAPAEHYKLRDGVDAGYAEFVRDDGSLLLPARALVAAATA